jgi:hypothetical protein
MEHKINFSKGLFSTINLGFKAKDLEMILICFRNRLNNLRINKNRINHSFLWHFKMFPQIISIKITIWITTKIKTMGFNKHRINLDNMEDFNKPKYQVSKNLKFKPKIQTLDLLINHRLFLNKVTMGFKLQIMIINNLKINFVTYRIWAVIQKCNQEIKMVLVELSNKIIIKWEVFHNILAFRNRVHNNFHSIKMHDQII